jgi:hypothetical protein
MNAVKKFLARKRDWEELTQSEVRAALRRQEIEHEKEINRLRLEQFKLKDKFEKDIRDEIEQVNKDRDRVCQHEINRIAQVFKEDINKRDREILGLKDKVKFAQRFWRSLYSEKDELHNIAIMLQSKAELSLKSERDDLQSRINKRADDMKQINICVQQIELIARRIEKQNEFGDRLLSLLPEEE